MTDEQIKYMVNRFLAWRLPQPWRPDPTSSALTSECHVMPANPSALPAPARRTTDIWRRWLAEAGIG